MSSFPVPGFADIVLIVLVVFIVFAAGKLPTAVSAVVRAIQRGKPEKNSEGANSNRTG
ncbi:MAG: hypothetical protein D6806_17000 [Deltaproteobacteria bacterium]|nr:MAG: hypothetical protein D6806_17000 [Deltaproteobacteria bacterium]